MTMKALALHGLGDLRLENVTVPTAEPGSVVVRVLAAPVWDYISEIINGERIYPLTKPLIFGTCCVGRVEDVGPDVTTLSLGQLIFCDFILHLRDSPTDRVILGYHGGMTPNELKLSSTHWKNGCLAELALFPSENVHALNEALLAKRNILPSHLAEIASLNTAIGSANAINLRAGETVLVLPATGFFSSSALVVALSLGARVIAGSRNKESLNALFKHLGNDGQRATI